MRNSALILAMSLIVLAGCTTVQRGAGTGAAVGGALGAIIGHQSGETTEGALIGAGAGAIAGGLIAEQMETKFCPQCGRRFTASVEYCPYDGAPLEQIEGKGN